MSARSARLSELPWLALPAEGDRARLRAIADDGGVPALLSLRQLAQLRWDEAGLRSIGRKVRKVLAAGERAALEAEARAGNLVFTRLQVLASSTYSHMADALVGSALRFGIVLDLAIAEYEEPVTWIETHVDQLGSERPNFTLLALDRRHLALSAALGDGEDESRCVERAVDHVLALADRVRSATGRAVILQTLPGAPDSVQLNLDRGLPGTPRRVTALFNLRLAERGRAGGHMLLDVAGMAETVGQAEWSPGRYAAIAKYPFAVDMTPFYGDHLFRILAAQLGRSRRVLVFDLDNTLWGGVIGDDGIEGIVLGMGSPLGEAHSAIQRMGLAYRERGIVLCVSSKNEESIALDAFRRHPEMVLKEDDIVLFRVNWDDKASNITLLANTLELGLDSFVFIDDNPVERKQVRDALPMVAVPELPADPSEWPALVHAAGYFEQIGFSKEDQSRVEYYKANARRMAQFERIGDHDEFLRSLEMTLIVAPFDAVGRKRIAQLISKSNQFNLTTRRYSEGEVAAMESDPSVLTVQARLVDIFGDNGMISTVICRRNQSVWEIDTWVMSCRVLGRRMEETMLNHLVSMARAAGISEIRGRYIPTAKNGLVKDHYAKLGFNRTEELAGGETVWSLSVSGYTASEVPIAIEAPNQLLSVPAA